MNMHVHACVLSSPTPTVGSRRLPAASSLSSHEDNRVGLSPSVRTPQSQVVSLLNPTTIDREGHAGTLHDERNLTYPEFAYTHADDTGVYTHPIAQRCLLPTPMDVHPIVNFQSDADQRHEDDQSGQADHL
ncbi:hypothetical protein GT037_001416 [Alternaria burnsii]|uniref:Uncharacterized protein n=1 Tax=Alternaria burnsii TaxID=1187904 RepID=A0A8H7BCW1_9PLEO|nr:uncharacterized protein GT037_001416 [Alternaria burnsii]KAF7679765.1 hypothetical protein GT037_001416 [Alternaria burnsii]